MNEIKAYQIEPGFVIATYVQAPVHTPFRAVATVVIAERNEWLTVIVTYADGGQSRHGYYDCVLSAV